MQRLLDNPAQARPQPRGSCLRPNRQQFRPFSGSLSTVVERKQPSGARTHLLIPPDTTHALNVSQMFAAAVQLQTLEREASPTKTWSESGNAMSLSTRPASEQTTVVPPPERPRTSARRKRRFVRKPEQRLEHEQHIGSSRGRKNSRPQLSASEAAAQTATDAQHSRRNLTRQEESALCSAIQVITVVA